MDLPHVRSLLFGCLAAGALPGCLNPTAFGAAAPAKLPVTTAPPSSGLSNDWLRKTWPDASPWDVGGEFRVRYELRDDAGSFPNNDFLEGLHNSNDFALFRTKIHLGYAPTTWVHAYVEGRDSHSIGDTRAITEKDSMDLHQAFLGVGDPKQFPLTAQIGRQEFNYGDQRYLGPSDWSNVGRSFDAARLHFELEGLWVDAFAGRQVIPRDGYFNVVNDYDWLTGVYASSRRGTPFQDTELYFLARNVGEGSPTAITPTLGGPGPRDIYTIGTRWKSVPGTLGPWDYTFEAAGQFGNIRTATGALDHRAYAIDATVGYTWKETFGSPRVSLGYDLGSGDSNPNDDENKTFDLLFGTNHRLYGLMDILGLRNLHIPRAGFSLKPAKTLTVSVEWLGFWMAETADFLYPESGPGRNQNGYGRNPGFDAYVGNEIDLIVQWRPAQWGQLHAGYGHFFPGDTVRQSAAADGRTAEEADWLYFQGTLSF